MISLASGLRIYLACGMTDMRKGMSGLVMLVQRAWPRIPSMGQCLPFVDDALG
jgi:transposase